MLPTMKHFISVLALCVTTGALAADEKPLDGTSSIRLAQDARLHAGPAGQGRVTPDGKAVLFLRGQAKGGKLSLHEFNTAAATTRELLTPEQVLKGAEEKLSPEEKARRERMRVSGGGFTDFQLAPDGRLILLMLSGHLYVVDRTAGAVRELKISDGTLLDPKFSPDSKLVSYVRNHDLYVYDLKTDVEHAVTKGGTEKKTHGLAEFVAQEEMNRFTGYWWSPDSRSLAYEEADADGVETWYVADPSRPGDTPESSFYPRPGKNNVKVRLGIVPVAGGPTVWVEWDREHYPVPWLRPLGRVWPADGHRTNPRSKGVGPAPRRSSHRQDHAADR